MQWNYPTSSFATNYIHQSSIRYKKRSAETCGSNRRFRQPYRSHLRLTLTHEAGLRFESGLGYFRTIAPVLPGKWCTEARHGQPRGSLRRSCQHHRHSQRIHRMRQLVARPGCIGRREVGIDIMPDLMDKRGQEEGAAATNHSTMRSICRDVAAVLRNILILVAVNEVHRGCLSNTDGNTSDDLLQVRSSVPELEISGRRDACEKFIPRRVHRCS